MDLKAAEPQEDHTDLLVQAGQGQRPTSQGVHTENTNFVLNVGSSGEGRTNLSGHTSSVCTFS